MEDTRKYFDYELAYKMYQEVIYDLNFGGIEEVALDFKEVGDRENGYTSFYGDDYNTWVYLVNKNFGTDKEEKWYVSGEVDIISYGYGEDNLYINNKKAIEERIIRLLDFAKKNDYTLDDIYKEYESLIKVLQKIKNEKEVFKMKLCNLVDIVENNIECVLLKVKDNKQVDLLKLGCFYGNEEYIRLTKGKDHTCTIITRNGEGYDWKWGTSGYTLVSDNMKKKGKMIENCIVDDFNIYIGSDKQKILDTLYIKSLEDTKNNSFYIKVMYFNEKDSKCVHKNGEYYRHFRNMQEIYEHFYNLGYNLHLINETRSNQTNCYIDEYLVERGEV